MASWRGVAAKLLLLLLSTALLLGALEAAARFAVRRRLARPLTTRGSMVRYHPTLGWDKPPGARYWLHRSEYSVELQVNAHGLRGPERAFEKPAGVTRTLLLGDSQTEGYTVAEERTVRALLERELDRPRCRHEVLNGGTIGYSTDQEYLFFLEQGRRYAPDVVVVLFCWNDVYFNTSGEQGKPFFELADGRLLLRNSPVPAPQNGAWVRAPEPRRPRLEPWRGSMALRLLSERTAAGNPSLQAGLARLGLVEPARPKKPVTKDLWPTEIGHEPEVAEMWRVTTALFGELKRAVQAQGGRLVVFYVPERAELLDRDWELSLQSYQGARRTWRRGRIFERLRQMSAELELPLVDPRQAMARAEAGWRGAYFPQDGHWNERGHAVAARELARVLVEARLAPCAGSEGAR